MKVGRVTDDIISQLSGMPDVQIVGWVGQMSPMEQHTVLMGTAKLAQTEQECLTLKQVALGCSVMVRKKVLADMRQDATDQVLLALWGSLTDRWDHGNMGSSMKNLCEAKRDDVISTVLALYTDTDPLAGLEQAILDGNTKLVKLLCLHIAEHGKGMNLGPALLLCITQKNQDAFDVVLPLRSSYMDGHVLVEVAARMRQLPMVKSLADYADDDKLVHAILLSLTDNIPEMARFLISRSSNFSQEADGIGQFVRQHAKTCEGMVLELLAKDNIEEHRVKGMQLAMTSWNFKALAFLIAHHCSDVGEDVERNIHKANNMACLNEAFALMSKSPNNTGVCKCVQIFLEQMSWDEIGSYLADKNTVGIRWVEEIKQTISARSDMRAVLGVDDGALNTRKKM